MYAFTHPSKQLRQIVRTATLRSLHHISLYKRLIITHISHKATANNQLTYAAAAAKYQDQKVAVYKPATFHKVDMDNNYLFPYEDIPHLLITGRYSGATLPKNDFYFRHISDRGQAATRETLQACRSYAIRTIRDRLGIALLPDRLGDPIIVVTKKTNDNINRHLIGDLRLRFPSKRYVISAYDQQRAPCRSTGDGNQRLLTHNGHIRPTLIKSRHIGNESTETSLHRAYTSCDVFRGKDSGGLSIVSRDRFKDTFEDYILTDKDFQLPDNFIDTFINEIVAANADNEEAITLSPSKSLYLFELSKIHKVGGIASPYASLEWPGVQIPQALTTNLQHKGVKIALINNDDYFQESIIYIYIRSPARRGLDFDEFPSQKSDFLRYAVHLNCVNPIRDITKCPLPPLEEIAYGIHIQLHDVIQKGTLSRRDLHAAINTAEAEAK
jgi:hypothetical protein